MPTATETPTEALLDGRYRLLELIGRGGSANVYRAEDQMLQRTVAIKLLRTVDGDAAPSQRAHRETGILASLNHPGLVTLLDAQLSSGRPQYLVMELIDGPTLSSRMAAGAIPAQTVAGIAHDIASALEAVHAAGIVHRDVKPSNILLAPPARPGDGLRAKLTDFGISRSDDDLQITSPGVAIGTAAYMAPEQVRCEPLTPAADVYALGLVLLEALTGTPPFPGEGGVPMALARLTAAPAVPESLGRDWHDLIIGMTRQNPADRPSAAEVADATSALVSVSPGLDVPLVAQEPGTEAATRPLPDSPAGNPVGSRPRHRRVIAAAVAAVLLPLVLALWVWAASGSASVPPRLAESPREKAAISTSDDSNAPPEQEATPTQTSVEDSSHGSEEPAHDDSGKAEDPHDRGNGKKK